ncbi:MAG: nitroreductase family protein [Bacteroidales bacterium]|nr:nitroreductase family protein [Bacteroidales bacterium]
MTDGKQMLELITSRQSDRKYESKPVEKEKLERIIEAARVSPSANNAQPWKFIVTTDPGLLNEIAAAASSKALGMNSFVVQAPVQIIVVREKADILTRAGSALKKRDYSLIDIGIASENICLQAEAEGLGSCMIGWFDEKQVKKILGIPAARRVELIITIGYTAGSKREKKRKPMEETVSYNKY